MNQAAAVQGPRSSSAVQIAPATCAVGQHAAARRQRRRAVAAAADGSSGGLSYKDAGVDIDAGNELVKRIQKLNPNIGGFSGMVPFGESANCWIRWLRWRPRLVRVQGVCSRLRTALLPGGVQRGSTCLGSSSRHDPPEGSSTWISGCLQATHSWWPAPTAWAPSSSWHST